jgi:uncharacterized protein (DUF1697 family)
MPELPTFISILRGINVSGSKLINMEALRGIYEGMGLKKVRTYIQSGNVVFQGARSSASSLENRISGAIHEATGFEVPVLVKSLEELEFTLEHNPFLKERKLDPSFLHVTFLKKLPESAQKEKISGDFGTDEFFFLGKDIYLFCPNGYGSTKLTNNYFENKLKIQATTRNWRTLAELKRMAGELD